MWPEVSGFFLFWYVAASPAQGHMLVEALKCVSHVAGLGLRDAAFALSGRDKQQNVLPEKKRNEMHKQPTLGADGRLERGNQQRCVHVSVSFAGLWK